jgi:hypothetical protein
VEATGGCRVWAERLGLRFSDGATSRRPWTEDRIRTTLSAYLAEKPVWPSRGQFTEDGFGRCGGRSTDGARRSLGR